MTQPDALKSTAHLPRVTHAKGSYLWDATGKQYIDGSGGAAVYCLGHANAEVNAAVTAQMAEIAHGDRYNFTTDALEDLTESLRANCGCNLTGMAGHRGPAEAGGAPMTA